MSDMLTLAEIAQATSVVVACWSIFAGIGAWKREFIGKRRIELAEEVLAKFFEVRDVTNLVRFPGYREGEGGSRDRPNGEEEALAKARDQAYAHKERFELYRNTFRSFYLLRYRFMATFGTGAESIFLRTERIISSILVAADVLIIHHFPDQFRNSPTPEKVAQRRHYEAILCKELVMPDPIDEQLQEVLVSLEEIVAPCFKEPSTLYKILTK
jgi:hypothetical protein